MTASEAKNIIIKLPVNSHNFQIPI